MPRVALLIAFVIGMAVHAEAAWAQPVDLPPCDLREKRETLGTGAIPDFRGCPVAAADRLLSQSDFRVHRRPDEAVSGIRPGIVTGQSQDGGEIVLTVSTGAGYPPPGGQDPGASTPPAGGEEPAATPSPPPPPVPEPVQTPRFSISGSPRATEGEPLNFRINREGDDGKPHRVLIEYDDRTFLLDPPDSIEFPAGDSSIPLQLATAADPAENGERPVVVRLEEVQGGRVADEGRAARGLIVDAAVVQQGAVAYSIEIEGRATRGEPIRFIVYRTGPLVPAELVYDVTQGGRYAPGGGGARRVAFGQDVPRLPIEVRAEDYDRCGEPVTITLQRGSPEEAAATADFTEFTPPGCTGTPPLWERLLNWLNTNVPWWPLIAALVAAVLGAAIWKLLRRNGNGKLPKPPPPVTAKCSMGRGSGRLDLSNESVGRWPSLGVRVAIERGIGRPPNPLPTTERSNG